MDGAVKRIQERPKLLSLSAKGFNVHKNRKNPHPSAPKINDRLRMLTNTEVCDQSVLNVLNEHYNNGCIARKTPYISQANIQQEQEFRFLENCSIQ